MNKKYLTLEDYQKFLNDAVYDAGKSVQTENQQNLKLSPKKFCDAQVEKFEGKNGNKTGCCLNFCSYLLKKYNGFILTCKDAGGIHCAFVYQTKNSSQLYVCDPAKEKIISCLFGGEIIGQYFGVPFGEYEFANIENDKVAEQEYNINTGFDSEDNDGKAIVKLVKGEKITVPELGFVDEDELLGLLNSKQRGNE